jgi:hypothetical protein
MSSSVDLTLAQMFARRSSAMGAAGFVDAFVDAPSKPPAEPAPLTNRLDFCAEVTLCSEGASRGD